MNFLRTLLLAGHVFAGALAAQPYGLGPYPPAHLYPGSTALQGTAEVDGEIAAQAPFVAWATTVIDHQPGAGLDFSRYPPYAYPPSNVLGPAMTPRQNDPFDVLPLGRGGSVTVGFAVPLRDGPGFDFAIFENAQDAYFLELAWVEVSSDGVHFLRFPNRSLTPDPVGAFQIPAVDTTRVDGLAGKYAAGYGTPFDLAALPDDPHLDKAHVRYVRIVDIVGDGTALDSTGAPIYDPFQTELTAGFDLDAIGVIHQALAATAVAAGAHTFTLTWRSNTEAVWSEPDGVEWILHREPVAYRIEQSDTLHPDSWSPVTTVPGEAGTTTHTVGGLTGMEDAFFRVVEVPPPDSP